ncbi:hypothetical protein FISHEDRAFT_76503 [Fistulina hepatica ATCC 64428]|uniref:Fungal-type protein kinase domain-containing protein n=1 Tax=Fistulina hepatica ATCC 64428 TaxID=1128425 RepID=A0A0D7A6W9_9AGAR|nr:hypothetical protein FISHEDRAFT_76503 [Fistulina hepatica ATCC 64428]
MAAARGAGMAVACVFAIALSAGGMYASALDSKAEEGPSSMHKTAQWPDEKGVEHVPKYQKQELFEGLSTFEQYRFVCTPLCRPLECADDVLQFAQAILDAFIAHMEAWEHPTNDLSKQVLHRDISDTNIQIGPSGRGYLIDWDLAILRQILMDCKESRRGFWTGTWYFMAASLLTDPAMASHGMQEDMESFFWVTVYLLLKFFRVKNVLRIDLPEREQACFDEAKARFINGRWRLTGGFQKKCEIEEPKGFLGRFQISRFPAFGEWLKQKPEDLEDEQDKESEDPSGLSTHHEMKKLFEQLMQSLEEPGMNAKFPPLPDQFAAQRKSERDESKNIAVQRVKQCALETLEREQQKLAIQQEAQQHSGRAGSSQASKTLANGLRHSASVSSSKRSSGQKRESGTLGEVEHSAPKRRRSSAVRKGMDL